MTLEGERVERLTLEEARKAMVDAFKAIPDGQELLGVPFPTIEQVKTYLKARLAYEDAREGDPEREFYKKLASAVDFYREPVKIHDAVAIFVNLRRSIVARSLEPATPEDYFKIQRACKSGIRRCNNAIRYLRGSILKFELKSLVDKD